MRSLRVGLPALIGLLLIVTAVMSTATAINSYGDSAAQAYRGNLLPGALGAAFVIASLATASRSRSGYLAGLAVGAVLALAGLALVVVEVGYLGEGGFSASIAIGAIVVGIVWTLLFLGYTRSIRRDRAAFAANWGPADRRFGIVVAALAAFSAVAYFAIGPMA